MTAGQVIRRPRAHWVASFRVEDANEAARKTLELRGEVLLPPTDVPGMAVRPCFAIGGVRVFGVFASGQTGERSHRAGASPRSAQLRVTPANATAAKLISDRGVADGAAARPIARVSRRR
jgi:hypothetical protein